MLLKQNAKTSQYTNYWTKNKLKFYKYILKNFQDKFECKYIEIRRSSLLKTFMIQNDKCVCIIIPKFHYNELIGLKIDLILKKKPKKITPLVKHGIYTMHKHIQILPQILYL